MGNSSYQNSMLEKGEGLRIMSIRAHSPFDGKVEPFFDFIIEAQPKLPEQNPSSERTTAEILDKLTGSSESVPRPRTFHQIINQNQDKPIILTIVSTKFRRVSKIEVTPNRNWNGSSDLIGITTRKQRYDQAFDAYFPMTDILNNSPIQKANIKEGQYLIGCMEFKYNSINNFIEGLYDRFFDKEIKEKVVNLAVYDLKTDQLTVRPVFLKRGWGGKGLLGCQFLQGLLNKFPSNLNQSRKIFIQKEQQRQQNKKLKSQLGQCDGVSKSLVQALRIQKNRKDKHLRNIRNMLQIEPPIIPKTNWTQQPSKQKQKMKESNSNEQVDHRLQILERRVNHLEHTLISINEYLSKIDINQDNQDRLRQEEIID